MKRVTALLTALVLLLALTACGTGSDKTVTEDTNGDGRWPELVTIATVTSGSSSYYIGAAQSQILSKAIDGVNFTAESTDGAPTTNGPLVQNDPDCLCILALNATQQLLEGTYPEMSVKLDKLRLVMVGNASLLQFVTLKETGITSMDDIKGKRIATANPGTAVRIATQQVLEAMGFEESDFASVTAMTPTDMADALKDGTIDVGVFNGGAPSAAVSDLDAARDIIMLQVPADVLDQVMADHPGYGTFTVPSSAYSDLTEDFTVLGIPMAIVANADMDDDLVYEITKTLNNSTEELAEVHEEGAKWNTENSLTFYNEGTVPFHPGAARYYDEIQGK